MSDGDLDVIIAGAGRVGRKTAKILDDHGHSVVVIERDGRVCEDLSAEYVAQIIQGDATQPEILRQARPGEADVIAALTGNAGANLGICVSAMRQVEGEVRTVLRVDSDAGESYREVVDEVIYPEALGAKGAANAVVGSAVRSLADLTGELSILEIRVAEGAPVAGRSLAEISIPRGSLVVSDAQGNDIAAAETVLDAGETYVVATEPEVAEEVTQLFRG